MSNISTRAIRSFTLGIGLAVSLLSASFAYAHATLVQSTPAANAVVASPQQIDLMFNETLVACFTPELAMIPATRPCRSSIWRSRSSARRCAPSCIIRWKPVLIAYSTAPSGRIITR